MKTIFILYLFIHSGPEVVSVQEIARFDSRDLCYQVRRENTSLYSSKPNEKTKEARAKRWGENTRMTFDCIKTGISTQEPMFYYDLREREIDA